MGRRGVTLVELMVVIAIVMVLAAVLFPVFARAKARAKQTTCMSNLHQLILARHAEGKGASLDCPLEPGAGYSVLMGDDAYVNAINAADPQRAELICFRHGELRGDDPGDPSSYDGIVLRVSPDASVRARPVKQECRTVGSVEIRVRPQWKLFTDAPCPPEYCPTDLHPCN